MLSRLYISNFALINEMDVSFPGGLTVITGETGAGKSIFLEALGLALGQRADLSALKNKGRKCVVEAEFDVDGLDLHDFFRANDLDPEKKIVLRREISSEGKSRSFLNDALVGLGVLKELSEKLVDIHSQHQTLLLNNSHFQLGLLDAFAGSGPVVSDYQAAYGKLAQVGAQLRRMQEEEIAARKELDYTKFLFEELSAADIRSGQLAALEQESLSLENAEAIKAGLLSAAAALGGGQEDILSGLAGIRQSLQSLSRYGSAYAQYSERMNSAYIELKDLERELAGAGEDIHFDAGRLEEVNQRLDQVNRLLKKHNVKDEEGLIEIRNGLEEKLGSYGSLESQIEKAQKEATKLRQECISLGKQLSALRVKAVAGVEKAVTATLSELSMQNAAFRIELAQLSEPAAGGMDTVKFMFSANKGIGLSELHKVASGGELSRLMLTLKSLLAERKNLPVIIFDEIDSGVSGDVGDKIGNILVRMGCRMQVIAITHLPQIASKGRHHLFVYKNDNEDQTVSHIKELSGNGRITEIAKMLSTGTPTESALKNAKELLSA